MSSDSSFPRPPTKSAQPRDEAPFPREREARSARVLDFRGDAPADGDAARSTERLRRGGDGAQVVAFPGQRTHKRRRAESPVAEPPAAVDESAAATHEAPTREADARREPSGPQRAPEPIETPAAEPDEVERPRFLASELLRQDWYPRTPLCRSLRWGSLAIGAVGAAMVPALGASSPGALTIAGLLAVCALLGALPIPAQARGVALALLGLAGTALAGWLRMDDGHEPAAPLLVACVTLSASALFFRAAHRTARLARALVGIGLAATAGWLLLTGGLDALVIDSLAWHDWVFPALRFVLGLLVVSTLLTFLDPTGHGGAWVAGTAFVAWLALETVARIAVAAWPATGASTLSLEDPAWIATFVFPLLAVLAAGGLCQLWVLVSRPPNGRREAPSRATLVG